MRLLVVEDEKELLLSIGKGLDLSGYYVDLAETGEKALDLLSTETYDLIILDLNLPNISGFDILKEVIDSKKNTKILILTANSDLDIKIKGLDLGASDYIVKPFHFEELEARIRVLLRRKFNVIKPTITFGSLNFDTVNRELSINNHVLSLTKKETAIIEYFLLNQDRIISTEELLSHAWDSEADYFSNSVRVHLTTLRKKLKTQLGYNPISNKPGQGYYLVKETP